MRAHASSPTGPAGAVAFPGAADHCPSPVTGGERLALATSLRARGLRGLDVLRRSQDRAPPTGS
jgi:predicted 2-oxoglutarate/Fe(II)-dependent dioxygenase YbiX